MFSPPSGRDCSLMFALLCLGSAGAFQEDCEDAPSSRERLLPGRSSANEAKFKLAAQCHDPPCFALRRLPKTGGTFMTTLLTRVVDPRRLVSVKDFIPLPCSFDRRQHFVVGTIRNPCSFYTSLMQYKPELPYIYPRHPWAAGSPPDKARLAAFVASKGVTPLSLAQWLVGTLSPNGDGYFSYLFWNHWLRNECMATPLGGGNCSVPSAARELQAASLRTLADCWVYQGTLDRDLHRCLEAYVRRYPQVRQSQNLEFAPPST